MKRTLVALLFLVLSACATGPGKDPLGTVANDPDTGAEGELKPDSFIIVREVSGEVGAGTGVTARARAFGKGLRVLEKGDVQGCVEYNLGNASYKSKGCFEDEEQN